MMEVAVIGCGGISAFVHVPQLLSMGNYIHISYLCDRNLTRARRLANRYNLDAQCVDDYNMVLNDDNVKTVIIAVWPSQNLQLGLMSIKKRKHTLIQKPLIGTDEEFKELINYSRDQTVSILALPYIDIPDLKSIVTSGELGKINYVRIRTAIPGPEDYYEDVKSFYKESENSPYYLEEYAYGRGALSDMGTYALSLYHYLFGEAELQSFILFPRKYDRMALINLKSDTLPCCSIDIAWNQIQGVEICGIYGNKGTVCIKADGSIGTMGIDKQIKDTVELPLSPFEKQKQWLLSIINRNENKNMNHSVITAAWVSRIINKVYKTI